MYLNSHTELDLVKIDIEGAEYRVIDSIIEDKVKINILCVEFDEYHHPLDTQYKSRIRKSVNRILSNGYFLVFSDGKGNYTFVSKILKGRRTIST